MNNRLTVQCHDIIASEIQALDYLARQMEQTWGAGRLPLLVGAELRLRFHQQIGMLNTALENDQASREDILMQIGGCKRAWQALDQVARAGGHLPTPPTVWEIPLEDGTVALLVRDEADAGQVATQAKERRCALYSLAEVGRLLSRYPAIAKVKEAFPGAIITSVQSKMPTAQFLNDDLPF
jgi:hypothetical protein